MIKMDRDGFETNLCQALEDKDIYVSPEDLKQFLNLNFDEDSSLAKWDYAAFSQFAYDVADRGFWVAVDCNDLHYPDEDKYVEDERSEMPWDFGKHFE